MVTLHLGCQCLPHFSGSFGLHLKSDRPFPCVKMSVHPEKPWRCTMDFGCLLSLPYLQTSLTWPKTMRLISPSLLVLQSYINRVAPLKKIKRKIHHSTIPGQTQIISNHGQFRYATNQMFSCLLIQVVSQKRWYNYIFSHRKTASYC